MRYLRRSAWAGAASLLVAAALTRASPLRKPKRRSKDQKDANDQRPKVSLQGAAGDRAWRRRASCSRRS